MAQIGCVIRDNTCNSGSLADQACSGNFSVKLMRARTAAGPNLGPSQVPYLCREDLPVMVSRVFDFKTTSPKVKPR
jgi:hypothetical protein